MYNPYSPFGPIIELPSEKAFISELPYHILIKGQAADVPWLSSVATHEGLYPGAGISLYYYIIIDFIVIAINVLFIFQNSLIMIRY